MKIDPEDLRCTDSPWMDDRIKYSSKKAFDIPITCEFSTDLTYIDYTTDRDIITRRCEVNNLIIEVKLTSYKDDEDREYFGNYYCSRAYFPKSQDVKIGSVTISPEGL